MVLPPEIQKIDESLQFRNRLLAFKDAKHNDKDQIIREGLEMVREKVNCSVASIFLLSKRGLLERVGILGLDRYGQEITNKWFTDEHYDIGEKLTGKAVSKNEGLNYGRVQYLFNPDEQQLKDNGKLEYFNKLERIESIICLPLNGQSRTYGILEVISDRQISAEEITWLSGLGKDIATALSNYRRNKQSDILTSLGKSFVDFDVTKLFDSNLNIKQVDADLQDVYDNTVTRLISPDTSFQVCILRIRGEGQHKNVMKVKAIKASDDKFLENRNNEDRTYGQGFVWEAINQGKPKLVEDIESELHNFISQKWIKCHGFKSFGCFPLISNKEIVGTLSIFVGYKYSFHESCINFLESVTSQIAAFEDKVRQAKILKDTEDAIDSLGINFMEKMTSVKSQIAVSEDKVRQANTLKYIEDVIDSLERFSVPTQRQEKNSISEQISKRRLQRIGKLLKSQLAISIKDKEVKTGFSNNPINSQTEEYTPEEYIARQEKLFEQQKYQLLELYKDKYVLFENGQVLDVGEDRTSLAMKAYKTYGMKPLFIEKVGAKDPDPEIWTPLPDVDV